MKSKKQKKGFTLIEILVAMAILTALSMLLFTFQRDIFVQNSFIQSSLVAESEARGSLKRAIAEIRAAAPSSTGQYPISTASGSSLTFYSDIDNDGLRERLRYFVATSTLFRGMTEPTGAPSVYSDSNEFLSAVVHNVINPTSTPVFSYYDNGYDGSSTPIALPVDVSIIRLVKMNIIIDADPAHSPSVVSFTSQVTIRSLKDNL
jgi:prepilin-type N-terminal cleavage/methylation domain-containing protein